MNWTIWHNPRCRKSRETLALLKANGIRPSVRLYLKDGPSEDEIRTVLVYLEKAPRDLLRLKEPLAKELGLRDCLAHSDKCVDAMASHPSLIERPVAIRDERAVLGRPPEAVLALL